jgi:ketosteroid isomerase-like protein
MPPYVAFCRSGHFMSSRKLALAFRSGLLRVLFPLLFVSSTEAQNRSRFPHHKVPRSDSAAARRSIEREWTRIIAQLKKGDWDGLSKGWTDDGVYVSPERPDKVGYSQLRAMFETEAGPNLRLVNLTREVTHFIVDGDVVLEGARSTEEWRDARKPGTEKSALRYLYVWKRQPDGRWRIRYLTETPEPPDTSSHP